MDGPGVYYIMALWLHLASPVFFKYEKFPIIRHFTVHYIDFPPLSLSAIETIGTDFRNWIALDSSPRSIIRHPRLSPSSGVQAVVGSIVWCTDKSRLYRLGVSQAQKAKESGDERPRLRAS